MVRIIMHGCNGHMGQVISALAAEDADVEIVAGIDANTEKKTGIRYFQAFRNAQRKRMWWWIFPSRRR